MIARIVNGYIQFGKLEFVRIVYVMRESSSFNKIISELDKLENFSPKYKAELRLLSKKIRKDFWNNNDVNLLNLLVLANRVIDRKYPNRDVCTYGMLEDYIDVIEMLGAIFVPKLTAEYYEKLADEIQLENARVIIEKKWDIINSSSDSEKSFIEIFDDVFSNTIDKHDEEFFYPLKKTDVLCRVVNGWGHNTDRFIPWPNKTNNRWNPPGRTYLYLSFSETPQTYSDELSLNEYICLEEYRAERGNKYSFCLFEPLVKGKILDLSYNDIELATIKRSMDIHARDIKERVLAELTADSEKVKHYIKNPEELKKEIKNKTEKYHNRKVVEDAVAKQYLKMVCNTIYKKVDEKDEVGKEKAYKSFHVLSMYLESKGVTGIIYPCTRTNKVVGKNLVLFNPADAKPIGESIREVIY